MKRHMLMLLAIALLLVCFAGCGSNAQPNPENQTSTPEATEQQAETEPAFDLEAYKTAIDQCRKDIMDNYIYPGNMASYELNYIKISQNIDGSADAEKGVQGAIKWLEEKTSVTLTDIESANKKIRDEYAALITTEIEGKEAEELDKYIRDLYEGYSMQYSAAMTGSSSGSILAQTCSDAMDLITTANSNISLFCGDYGE